MEQRFQVGIITSTHGLRGEVKVFPTTEDMRRFKKLKEVELEQGKMSRMLQIESVKFFKQFVILKFKGLDRIEDVETFRQAQLYVDRAHAIPLGENENYVADLFDMQVVDEDGHELGILTDVIETGANDVYQVTTPKGKDILIPAIRDCILDVNVEENLMKVHLLDGLLDLND